MFFVFYNKNTNLSTSACYENCILSIDVLTLISETKNHCLICKPPPS